MKKNSTQRSPPDVELPDPDDQDPLEPPPDQELELRELEDREPLELCDPL